MKEKTTKTVIFGPNIFDLIGTEQWLSDMAKEGWLFDKFHLFFSVGFKKNDPKPNRRYRFITNDLLKSLYPSEEQLGIYEASGWIFADFYRDFNLFYNDDPDAPEIFSEERDFKKNTRRYLWILVAMLLGDILYGSRFIYLLSDNSLHSMEDQNILTIILTRVILALCIILLIAFAIEFTSGIIKVCSVGAGSNRNKPSKGGMVIHAIIKALSFLFSFLIILFIVIALIPNSKTNTIRDLSKYQDTHPVTLEEIDPDNAVRLQEVFNGISNHLNYPYDYECISTTKSGLVFSEKKTMDYHVRGKETSRIQFTSNYGEFRDGDNAIPYILEELEIIDENLGLEDIRIPSDTVDYLGYYMDMNPDINGFTQYVFAQKGNKIAIGEYHAEVGIDDEALLNPDDFLDLKALAHIFAEEVNEE